MLEPFRVGHEIQVISGGTGIISSGVGVGDLDRAPGAPTAGMMPVGPTNDLEDPPGLYEKVSAESHCLFLLCMFIVCCRSFRTSYL